MNGRERYIRKVLDTIYAPSEERARLQADLESHFAEGEEAGKSEGDIIRRLGPPDEVAAAFMENVQFHFAGFWIRVFAFVTDLAVCLAATIPLLCVPVLLFGPDIEEPGVLFFVSIVPLAMWTIAVFLFYFPALEAHFGKTLGKHLVGLRVLNEDGTKLGLGKALLRRLSYYFEFLAVDALFAAFTEKKQRALDILSKTIVVREDTEIAGGVMISLGIIAAPIMLLLVMALLMGT